jgi:hypothetical protein
MHVSGWACLLAVTAAAPTSAEVRFAAFFPVASHCGARSSDPTELISENKYGARERVRIWYQADDVAKIAVGAADQGKAFEDTVLPDVEDADSPATERTITGLTETMEPFRRACHGDAEAKARIENLLREGRANLARDK